MPFYMRPVRKARPLLTYTIRQQDDTLVEMNMLDTLNGRLFVAWVKRYEGIEETPRSSTDVL